MKLDAEFLAFMFGAGDGLFVGMMFLLITLLSDGLSDLMEQRWPFVVGLLCGIAGTALSLLIFSLVTS